MAAALLFVAAVGELDLPPQFLLRLFGVNGHNRL
jgi:hypothetical protein